MISNAPLANNLYRSYFQAKIRHAVEQAQSAKDLATAGWLARSASFW